MTEIHNNQLKEIISNSSKIDPLKYIDGPKEKTLTQDNKIKINYQHGPRIYRQGDILMAFYSKY